MNIFDNIYRNKRVLVTGHTGFKGSWLTFWLCEMGAQVAGYSLEPDSDPSMFNILTLSDGITHVIDDVRNLDSLKELFNDFKPEFVFHLAAQPIVRASYSLPHYTFETNVMGTANVLESVRETGSVRVVVNITSDKCYENREWIYGYKETDPMGGHDPYSASKGCAEIVISSYRDSFFNPETFGKDHNVAVSSTRAGNVIGGGDWAPDRLVPDCVRFITTKEEIIIRSPDSVRPWQHVLEPLSGYLWLGCRMYKEPKAYSSAWNFGPSDSDILTVETLVSMIIESWGAGGYRVKRDSKLHEATLLKLDISKAKFKLDWDPVLNAGEAIDMSVEWYKSYYNKMDMNEVTRKQLSEYIERAKAVEQPWSIK